MAKHDNAIYNWLIKQIWSINFWYYSEELAQRLQEEENLAAQQAQEEQSGRGRRENQPFPSPVDPHQPPPTSSSSRQVERHESQRTKNVRLLSESFFL